MKLFGNFDKKRAFTLAETMIVMSVIGVVATMTIPVFYNNAQKKIYATKIKSFYGKFQAAVEKACIDENVDNFARTKYATSSYYDMNVFFNKYFKTRTSAGTYYSSVFASSSKYKSLKGENNGLALGSYASQLTTGEAVSAYCSRTTCYILVDTNAKKNPNRYGRDTFYFAMDPRTNEIYDLNTSSNCGSITYGRGCLSNLIENNWSMEY